MYALTRGQLNNNPCNIRISTQKFDGEIVPSKDKNFKQFVTAEMGLRAAVKILITYAKVYNLNTVRQIISRWAPNDENNTDAYIACVSHDIPCGSDDAIDILQPMVMGQMLAAIVRHENGVQPYNSADINAAVQLAFS